MFWERELRQHAMCAQLCASVHPCLATPVALGAHGTRSELIAAIVRFCCIRGLCRVRHIVVSPSLRGKILRPPLFLVPVLLLLFSIPIFARVCICVLSALLLFTGLCVYVCHPSSRTISDHECMRLSIVIVNGRCHELGALRHADDFFQAQGLYERLKRVTNDC